MTTLEITFVIQYQGGNSDIGLWRFQFMSPFHRILNSLTPVFSLTGVNLVRGSKGLEPFNEY